MDPAKLRRDAEERELRETLRIVDNSIDHIERIEAEMGVLDSPRLSRLRRAYEMAATEIDRRLRRLR